MLKLDLTKYHLDNNLLKTAIVLIDTRENENTHIKAWLDKHKIAYEERKLDYADYMLKLPKNESYGIMADLLLEYGVERKASLEEVSGNLTNDRNRIEEELWRGSGKMCVVIENGSLDKIAKHDYKTQYAEKSFKATLITYMHRYNVPILFCEKEISAETIYAILYYKLREVLK